MKKHLLTLLLAMWMLASVGCSNAPNDETPAGTESPVSSAEITEPEIAETEPEIPYVETLEQRDLEGYTYRMVAQHMSGRPNFANSDELTGEVLQDAIIQRKMLTMDRLNIKIEEIAYEDRGKLRDEVGKTIRAGDDAYDIVLTALSDGINTLTQQGCFLDLTTVPHLTLDSSLWNASMATNMRIDGKQYFTTGVTSISYLYTPQTTLFNKDIAEENGLPSLYSMVLEGRWTVDNMKSLMNGIALDLNGDGQMTPQDDRYSFIVEGTYGNALYMAAGFQCVYPDADGNWALHLADQNSVDFIDSCAKIFSDPATVYTDENAAEPVLYSAIFSEGRTLFMAANINHATSLREMESNFGVLPIPVLNEGDPYLTSCNTWLPSGIGIPVTSQDLERTGLIMETMAAYSYEQVLPAIMEKTLGKTARDEESYQIMMMMYDNSAFDFNTIMDFGGTSSLLRGSVIGARENFTSSYKSIEKLATKTLEKFIDSCRTGG